MHILLQVCDDDFLQRLFKFSAVNGGDPKFLLGHLSSQDINSFLPELKCVGVRPCLYFHIVVTNNVPPAVTSNTLHFVQTML